MVRPRDLRGRARSAPRLRHDLRRGQPPAGPAAAARPRAEPVRPAESRPAHRARPGRPTPFTPGGLLRGLRRALGGELVEPGAQPLGQPPGVGEHDRGAVLLDEVEHPLLDVRPDRPLPLRVVAQPARGDGAAGAPGGRGAPGSRRALGGGPPISVMSSTGTTTFSSSRFSLGGCTTVTWRAPPRKPATSATGRTVADSPIRCAGPRAASGPDRGHPQRVQALQRDRQVRAALVAGQRVHLVHDDRLHAPERLPRLGGEQQEQRFRRGDQHVGRLAGQLPALVGGGVTGPHRDVDVRLGQAQIAGRVPDTGQRGAQVPLDVGGQRLERGDVQDPAPPLRVGGRRRRRQPVQRPQEGRERLAGAGGRDDQRVVALADGRPGLRLCLRRLREDAREPGAGRGGEALQRRAAGSIRALRHSSILPRTTDSSVRPRIAAGFMPLS